MSKRLHCIPVDDDRVHVASPECWCFPLLEQETGVHRHNAMDCREVWERQGLANASPGWMMVIENYDATSSDMVTDRSGAKRPTA